MKNESTPSFFAYDWGVYPITAQLEVTRRCNFRCTHCYIDNYSPNGPDFNRIDKLLDDLAKLNTQSIILTGGEPLLRKDIYRILESIKLRNIKVTLYSNAYNVNISNTKLLVELVDVFEISLYGLEDIHDAITNRRGSFERACYAIGSLSEGSEVIVKTPLFKANYKEATKIKELAISLGAHWEYDYDLVSSELQKKDLNSLKLTLKEKQLLKHQLEVDDAKLEKTEVYTDNLCRAGRQFIFIDASGDVYPCMEFRDFNIESKRNNASLVGNINEQSIVDIWNRSDFLRYIRQIKRSDISDCKNCPRKSNCNICIAINLKENNDILIKSTTRCDITKNIFPEKLSALSNPEN